MYGRSYGNLRSGRYPSPRTCNEMSRLANVSANDPREGILRYLTLQALCREIPRSKRFVARTASGYGGPDARRPNPVQPRPYRPRRVGFG